MYFYSESYTAKLKNIKEMILGYDTNRMWCGKKPYKEYILYNFIYMEFYNGQKYQHGGCHLEAGIGIDLERVWGYFLGQW